jgi:hypothetical protein
LPRITMNPKARDAGYADGLAGRPRGTDPLHEVDELAYASGYVEGKAGGKPSRENLLLDALAAVASILGPGGSFPHLGRGRTEEILLMLVLSGRILRGHKRLWEINIAPEHVAAVRAAGGYLTLDEWEAAKADRARRRRD